MARCLICHSAVNPFMSLGEMPIANGFLPRDDFDHESFFELQVGYCRCCHLVQLTKSLEPGMLFHDSYAYYSSISTRMTSHFQSFAGMVLRDYLKADDPLVVEIGSNDGILLENFMRAGVRHVGVEPSANVAEAARRKGVNTVCRFFDEEAARDLRHQYGPADVFLGANVICHLPNIHAVMRGIQSLLKDEGLFIFEEPYLGNITEKAAYDQIYDEHFSYFCLHSLKLLFRLYEMEIIDALPQNVHGGSMRYVVGRLGRWPVKPAVQQQLAREEEIGLTKASTYDEFRRRVYYSRDHLLDLLTGLKKQGKRIVGYGATSKSTTVTNFCRIGPDLLDYISDTTPGKQGRFNPGTHIPIRPYEAFKANYPDYALLFAWNHGEEILEKEQTFRQQGGKFITYIPEVRVLN